MAKKRKPMTLREQAQAYADRHYSYGTPSWMACVDGWLVGYRAARRRAGK